jgi:hypothetical protein
LLSQLHAVGRTTLGGIPIWVAWGINIVAWDLFVSTGNHAIDFNVRLARPFAFSLAFLHSNTTLMIICEFDVAWIWAWAFGLFGDSISVADLLDRFHTLI